MPVLTGFAALAGCVVVGAAVLGGAGPDPGGTSAVGVRSGPPVAAIVAAAAVRYSAPVAAPLDVVRPFDPPTTPYGPGHLGVDLATRPGQLIRAAADGSVTFAGQVAGRGVVVLAHADGVSTEYEPLVVLVHAGATVRRGEPIGRVHGRHGTCSPGGCVHWGAKRDDSYFDPLSLLAPLGTIRLVPWPTPAG